MSAEVSVGCKNLCSTIKWLLYIKPLTLSYLLYIITSIALQQLDFCCQACSESVSRMMWSSVLSYFSLFSLFTDLNYLLWNDFGFTQPECERKALVLLLWGKWWGGQFFSAQWKDLMKLISAQPPNSLDTESMKEHVSGWLELSLISSDKTLSLCNSLNFFICSEKFFLHVFPGII